MRLDFRHFNHLLSVDDQITRFAWIIGRSGPKFIVVSKLIA